MAVIEYHERALQRGVHALLADPARLWTCTNGDVIQVIAAGLFNVHEGPDFLDAAVLFGSHVLVGDIEFHRYTSEWTDHDHSSDPRYASLLIHAVMHDDAPSLRPARWTIVMDHDEVIRSTRSVRKRDANADVAVEELQHFALLRLLRQTAEADALLRRLGVKGAIKCMATEYIDRLLQKRHRPRANDELLIVRDRIVDSSIGMLVQRFSEVAPNDVLLQLERCEKGAVGVEGMATRREIIVNAILPLLCVLATEQQRVVLLQWYWSARSLHPYGILRRRYPQQMQDHVWQQQGMLEHLRQHGRRASTCGEVIRSYGLDHTVQFISATSNEEPRPP